MNKKVPTSGHVVPLIPRGWFEELDNYSDWADDECDTNVEETPEGSPDQEASDSDSSSFRRQTDEEKN